MMNCLRCGCIYLSLYNSEWITHVARAESKQIKQAYICRRAMKHINLSIEPRSLIDLWSGQARQCGTSQLRKELQLPLPGLQVSDNMCTIRFFCQYHKNTCVCNEKYFTNVIHTNVWPLQPYQKHVVCSQQHRYAFNV